MTYVTWAAVIGLVSAYFLTPRVRALAVKCKILAHPGGRRAHLKPTPMWGGIALYAGFTLAVVIITFIDPKLHFNNTILGVLLGGSFVALVGTLDDKYELPGWFQALSIVVAGCILSLFDVRVVSFTNPFKGGSTIPLGLLSVPATVIWMLMVTKAVDCMDGMDGLAAGISAIAAGTLTLMAVKASPKSAEMSAMMEVSAVMGAALMGAALGFLRYNYPPAKLFMGTVGSQFLGFILAAISVAGAFKITTLVAVALPVLVLGVPLFDTTFVVLKRMVTGKRIDQADRTHLHHRLANKGLSTRQVIWIIYLITFAFCALAYALFMYVK